jgi:hypothetical protein
MSSFKQAFSRRQFIVTGALSTAAIRLHAQNPQKVQASLEIPHEATGPHMPDDFVGLSYEVQQLTDSSFFSAENVGLVRAFKELSPHGVLRLGGNTSEFAWWKPTPETPEPEHPHIREVVGEPKAQYYSITAEAVRHLAAFLKDTGWTCLYGINMGTNTPERAAVEADFAAKTLGSSLQYFQIGNEVDLFNRHLRDPQTWSPKTYLGEWLALARAIRTRVPSAKFGIPDIASEISWLPQIADLWSAVQNPPHITTLTHHHYFGGPATNPDVNIPNLLAPSAMAKDQRTADVATAAAEKMGVRVRMTEGNTCYRGGKPGVSDVFAAALWAADYSLLLASNNYSGINLHGGTGMSVANSVGGVLPGDVMLKDKGETPEQIASHPHPFYTPVATFSTEYLLEPVAYGLKFAGTLSGGRFIGGDLSAKLQAAGVNARAYAAGLPSGETAVIILNKDAENDLSLSLDLGGRKIAKVAVEALTAPALDSREAHIAKRATAGRRNNGKIWLDVPHASGIRVVIS